MQTKRGHLTYCSNIHSGETWKDHFANLRENVPKIKQRIAPVEPFGIGLRLSNVASLELRKQENLETLKNWLDENNCYLFTMNGFPYGSFHNTVVKDKVHAPDWLSPDRVQYTIRLAQILAALLPDGVDGGISTSPLSYKFWHKEADLPDVYQKATLHLLDVVDQLIKINRVTGKLIHIDIEPEPDGLLGNGTDFLQWYAQYLIPLGTTFVQDRYGVNEDEAAALLREHVQICYDVCHFAVNFENHHHIIRQLKSLGIKTGKIQLSAALKGTLSENDNERKKVVDAFSQFNEPVYLHQVVAKKKDGKLLLYPDMPLALADANNKEVVEWRAHYHVPLFIDSYGVLESTQKDIETVLGIHEVDPLTFHLEIETYTWEVLPQEMRLPLSESICRELEWVVGILKHEPAEKD